MRKTLTNIAIAVSIVILAVVVALNIVLSMIDKEHYKTLLQEKMLAATGRELIIGNAPVIGIFPAPYLQFSKLSLAAPEDFPATAPLVRAAAIRLEIPWLDAFSKSPSISAITVFSPALDIQRGRDGKITWGDLFDKVKNAIHDASATPDGQPKAHFTIAVEDGHVLYVNTQNNTRETLDNLNAHIQSGGKAAIALNGNAVFRGDATRFSLVYGYHADSPVTFQVSQADGSRLDYQGVNKSTDGSFRAEGTLKAAIPNLGKFLLAADEQGHSAPVAEKSSLFAAFTLASKTSTATESIPVTVDGEMIMQSDQFSITAAALNLGQDKGKLDASFLWTEELPKVSLDISLDKLSLSPWARYSSLFTDTSRTNYTEPEGSIEDFNFSKRSFPKLVKLNVKLSADNLRYSGHDYDKIIADMEISDGIFTLHELTAQLPGDTKVTAFGILTRPIQGLRFEGNIEAKGEKLKDTLMYFDNTASALPAQGFGAYSIRASLFISQDFLRLSEANLSIGDLQLNGGLVTYFESTPRVEAEIKFKDTNLDYFRDVWREQKEDKDAFSFYFVRGTEFSWLRNLGYIVDFTINLENFTFLERQGQTAALRLYARKNELHIIGLKMYYPDGPLGGSFKLDVSHTRPQITASVTAPFLDISYFSSKREKERTPWVSFSEGATQWSNELFDFSWMTGFTGNFDIATSQMLFDGAPLKNFKLKAELKDQALSLSTLEFDQLGGKISAKGSLIGSKVPGLSLNLSLYNVDLAQLLKDLPGLGMISNGRLSVNAYVGTSGIHLLSWITQAEMKMVISGRGIRVDGFNLDGVVNAVRAARSTADVVTSINSLMRGGRTEFSVDGSINVLRGVAKTPGMALKSGSVTGNFSGELAILPYKFNASSIFYFPQLSTEKTPSLSIDMAGPVENFAVEADSSSLEAWVSKRIISK